MIKSHKLHYKSNPSGSAVGQLTNDEVTENTICEKGSYTHIRFCNFEEA